MAQTRKKRSLKSGQRLLLILIIIFLVGYLLQKAGVPILYKTESTEIIEDPHPGY